MPLYSAMQGDKGMAMLDGLVIVGAVAVDTDAGVVTSLVYHEGTDTPVTEDDRLKWAMLVGRRADFFPEGFAQWN